MMGSALYASGARGVSFLLCLPLLLLTYLCHGLSAICAHLQDKSVLGGLVRDLVWIDWSMYPQMLLVQLTYLSTERGCSIRY